MWIVASILILIYSAVCLGMFNKALENAQTEEHKAPLQTGKNFSILMLILSIIMLFVVGFMSYMVYTKKPLELSKYML